MARDCIHVERGAHYLAGVTPSPVETKEHGPTELQKIRRELLTLSDHARKLAARLDVLITNESQD